MNFKKVSLKLALLSIVSIIFIFYKIILNSYKKNLTKYYIPKEVKNIVAIAAGQSHNLVLKDDGSIFSWGEISVPSSRGGCHQEYREFDVPKGLKNIIDIEAAENKNLVLHNDGTVTFWYNEEDGEIEIESNSVLKDVKAISMLSCGWIALKEDSSVYSGGGMPTNIPSGLKNIKAISTGNYHSLALKEDGTVFAWGDNSANQCDVPQNLDNVIAISAGDVNSLALKKDGSVVVW